MQGSVQTVAADANLKQELEKNSAAYAENFNRQDGAGIAALFASGGVHVNSQGPRTDIEQFYQAIFETGFSHQENKVHQALPLGTDAALAMGEYRMTGKNQSGAPIESAGLWTGVYIREGGHWKTRMLSAMPRPPQAVK